MNRCSRIWLILAVTSFLSWSSPSSAQAAPKFEAGDYLLEAVRSGADSTTTDPVTIEIDAAGGVKILSRTVKQRPPLIGKLVGDKLTIQFDEKGLKITLNGKVVADNEITGELLIQERPDATPLKGSFTIKKEAAK